MIVDSVLKVRKGLQGPGNAGSPLVVPAEGPAVMEGTRELDANGRASTNGQGAMQGLHVKGDAGTMRHDSTTNGDVVVKAQSTAA